MIHGQKPSAYFVTTTGDGQKVEGECRQCVHCQYTWEYRPGSGIERGYCLRCGEVGVANTGRRAATVRQRLRALRCAAGTGR